LLRRAPTMTALRLVQARVVVPSPEGAHKRGSVSIKRAT